MGVRCAYAVVMDEKRERAESHDAFARVFEWLNEKLMGPIGPPALGPYDGDDEPREHEELRHAAAPCPVCGHPMGEHYIDHSKSNAVLHCPAPPIAKQESTADLNEVGMPRRSREP